MKGSARKAKSSCGHGDKLLCEYQQPNGYQQPYRIATKYWIFVLKSILFFELGFAGSDY